MKRALSLLLVLVMLLSLCACGKDGTQNTDPSKNSSQATTNNTEKPTDGTENTTGETQAPTAPTKEPSTKPTETPTTPPTTCSHSYKDATCTAPKTCSTCGATEGSALGHSWNAATCTAPKTCSKCGATEGSAEHSWNTATCTAPKTCSKCGATEGSAAGHSYQNGICTGCGAEEVINHPFGTGSGYAMTVSSNEVFCYQISATELLYDLCTTEKPARGWYKFREHNGTTYYSPSPSWGWYSVDSYTISGKTVQLKVGPETMELELIAENQYKVTKGIESIPAGIVFTFGTDMCSFTGHLYERSCENDVACMYCGHIKCAGLGHEYGEDDICFRCFAAMRASN